MRANSAQVYLNDNRQKNFQMQQGRLKAMATTSETTQSVSADVLIENLLKDPFKKTPEMSTSVEELHHSYTELPPWLQCNSATVPAQYIYLWSLVQSTGELADTQKVSQLLLTSGLQVDMLGFIWSLANKAIPGQLTKQEFFIILALVSLVQTGHTFSNLNILKLLTVPSMPVLQLGLLKSPVPQFNVSLNTEITNFNTTKESPSSLGLHSKSLINLNEDEKIRDYFIDIGINKKILLDDFKKKNSNLPSIGSSPTEELEDDFSAFQSVSAVKGDACKSVSQSVSDSGDDFSEFQSANIKHTDPFETIVLNQKKEISKISLPKTLSGKFIGIRSNILRISENEKKFKVLSAAENLSTLPESKISSNNKVLTSISTLGSNHGIGSRLANHSFSNKFDKFKCHKHHKIKINQSSSDHFYPDGDVILGVKTKNLETLIPKCHPKNSCKNFLLKETKIRNDATEPSTAEYIGSKMDSSTMHLGEKTRQIEIPMLGTFNETVLPTQSKPQISNIDLITVQEDKYSALREIELELKKENDFNVEEKIDDFGDFLSANIPIPSASESPPSAEVCNSISHPFFLENEDKDGWGDWKVKTFQNSSSASKTVVTAINNSTAVGDNPVLKQEDDWFGIFNLLTIGTDKTVISQTNSFLADQQDIFNVNSKDSSVSNGLLFVKKSEKSGNLSLQRKTGPTSNNQLDNELSGFLSFETKSSTGIDSPTGNIFSRHGSLPSLDLKISPTDDFEMEIIWKKCINSCYSLIREGFDIFNNIVTKSVLDEVFAAPKTEDYLNNLNIVFQISKRVTQNFSIFSSTQDELEKLWKGLQELCFKYNIELKPDEDNCSEGELRCSICLSYVRNVIVNQGSNHYHPSCANLWVNLIGDILPSSI